MADFSSIARPYALAAFDFAHDQHQLPQWQAFLNSAACAVNQPMLAVLLNNPRIPSEKMLRFFLEILASLLTKEQKNFLSLLTQNKRLALLPTISNLFNTYYAALEKISAVKVITAIEIKDDFRQTLAKQLAKRIKHEVTLDCYVDSNILGGAIIQMGDNVIDDSVRGKLTRLLQNLTA